jgi:hypothetical protein
MDVTTTRTGRVVYNRKTHMFNERAAARITRSALNFHHIDMFVWEGYGLSKADEYAKYYFRDFVDFASRWNFFPRSMIYESNDESPVEDYAFALALKLAGYMGLSDLASEIAEFIYNEFLSGQFSSSFKINPWFASSIIMSVGQNTKTEGELYGHR